MKTIIAASNGINWTHYAVIQLNGDTAKIVDSWRAHNYENRGRHCKTRYSYDKIDRPVAIKKWMQDGRPGGVEGLRENYKQAPSIVITYKNRKTYIQEK